MTIFDHVILAILMDGCKNEADIYREVIKRTGEKFNRSTIHKALNRLLSNNFVARERVQNGKVYYTVEQAGRDKLQKFKTALGTHYDLQQLPTRDLRQGSEHGPKLGSPSRRRKR